MSKKAKKSALPSVFDLPLAIAAALTGIFYYFVTQESMHGSFLSRYTTEHAVEYVIVASFIWGLVDVVMRVLTFPRETYALKQDWLPPYKGRENISQAGVLLAQLEKKPAVLRNSRIGRRYIEALAYLEEKGSAAGLPEQLQHLADLDYELTQSNFGLIRFICWVTPMFGFLGTVIHFGTALSGQEASSLGENLPTVVAAMGTAFNATTVALTAATTMMFGLFLGERTERGIVTLIDGRLERDLLHRFDVADPSLTPFLSAVEAANQTTLSSVAAHCQQQMDAWQQALVALQQHAEAQLQWQSDAFAATLEKFQQRVEENEHNRESKLANAITALAAHSQDHHGQINTSVERVVGLQQEFAHIAQALSGVLEGEQQMVKLQTHLSDNLRLLHETQQIDQVLHELTAAIHLLTARSQSIATPRGKAA
jgi:biopolymer transport protein ExbB/TolQ